MAYRRLNSKQRQQFNLMLTDLITLLLKGVYTQEEAERVLGYSKDVPHFLNLTANNVLSQGLVGDENAHIKDFLYSVADILETVEKKSKKVAIEGPSDMILWFAKYLQAVLPKNDQQWT